MAQTSDGYLWLGTAFGVVRFDGVRMVPWEPLNQRLPSTEVWTLVAARDGTLWVGTRNGLIGWRAETFIHFAELDRVPIAALLEDRDGSMWATATPLTRNGTLCRIAKARVECWGNDGRFGLGAMGLYQAAAGDIWVGSFAGLWRWAPDRPQLFPTPDEPDGIQAFAEDGRTGPLIATHSGLKRVLDGRIEAIALPGFPRPPSLRRMLRDRDGGLWLGNREGGLLHLRSGRVDRFTKSDGLSGDSVVTMFEDREGNVWVATTTGLDRFREWTVPTLSGTQGVSDDPVLSLSAGIDESVWLSTADGLKRWYRGEVTTFRDITRPGNYLESQYIDHRGRHWIATRDGVGILANDRLALVGGVPGGITHAIGEDATGNVWIANQDRGLFRVSVDGTVDQVPEASLDGNRFISALIGDPHRAGMWLGFPETGLVYFADGQVRERFAARDGLGAGEIRQLRFDRSGVLWASTAGGLSRIENGRVATLSSRNGLPCDFLHWDLEDADRSFWIYSACGLVRIARSEIDAWVADPTRKVRSTIFGASEGVRITANAGGYTPRVATSSDGRFWFALNDGVSVIDPRHLPMNQVPPPVHVEQIVADQKAYDMSSGTGTTVRLPPLTRSLQIDYTALSLVAPDRVLFRYRLEGWDRGWQDVGNRRQAFYNDLRPGAYRFQVIASNNSGVWNETGASIAFAVAPAYYQTAWFQVLLVALFMVMLAALYRLRVQQVARQYNARVEARVGERMRIARELHDTLLQSFQGLLLKFHALSYKMGNQPEVRQEFEAVIEQARQAITEGRDAVQGLRASTLPGNDLARAIVTFGEELAVARGVDQSAELRVQVEGASRDLASLVHDDVYRIACEAVRNAYKHAGARQIEVEIHYDQRQLRLRIRDDGKGIDAGVLRQGARAGHYGLPGMHERASAIGGKLTVWSEVNSGTEVELTVPAAIAYARATASHSSTLAGSGA